MIRSKACQNGLTYETVTLTGVGLLTSANAPHEQSFSGVFPSGTIVVMEQPDPRRYSELIRAVYFPQEMDRFHSDYLDVKESGDISTPHN